MLPDYLKTKEKLNIMIDFNLKQAILLHLGPLANIRETINFEGSKTVMNRDDGSVSEMNPHEMKTEIEIKLEEMESMNHEMVLDRINTMAEKMAEKQAKFFYKRIGEFAEEVGNVVSAEGETISIDHFFEVLEKVSRDFDSTGRPDEIVVTASPELFQSIAKIIEEAKSDPEIQQRFDAIMEQKRKEWRVRESNRKLVG
ncbi:MAG: hypothetical protein OXI67_17260 [Candidatus Poribacteria bacterium]|nr:hypothetical protein [Candidatus Poribacteria bacterium]